ncbi:hypothetical protein [Plesiomonas sp. ZOR0011]|uniref:hypothetical protein n=1 Tax=Plesiomonas sp. ZOR0011 TaxID=1339230 RepID=UPI00068E3712|nr:hypothetical protein [Plesiomonas sp. ZOR0011]
MNHILDCTEDLKIYTLPVTEISSERFNEMFGVLPPMDWRCGGNGESFKLMEMYFAYITNIFARYGDRYFEMRDRVTLPHATIMERVRRFAEGN